MFVSAAIIAAAQILPITIATNKPGRIERPRAPIATFGPRWAATCKDNDKWDAPAPPVRIHGNSYYVGTCGIAAILVTGSAGHVLIDGGTEQGAGVIADNIRRLGFNISDVKFLLHSHEHFDHVGGTSKLQRLSGATLVASAPAAKVFATGAAGAGDPQAGMHAPFAAANVGRIVADGEEVRIGDLMLKALATPGHTPGALTWRWVSCEGGVCRTIVYADSLSAVSRDDYKFSAHPAYLAAFHASIARVEASECDILITPHPSASGLRERFEAGKPLFDEGGCKAYAAKLDKALDERLAKEAAGK